MVMKPVRSLPLLFLACLFIGVGPAAHAQDHDISAWPAVDVWVKLDSRTRLYFMGAASVDTSTGSHERSAGAAVDYKLGSKWSVRSGVREIFSSSEFEDSREHRLHVDAAYKWDGSSDWKFNSRSRIEMRWVEGKPYSTRVRERIGFEKPSHALEHIAWFGSFEIYHDSRYGKLSRTRGVIGVTWALDQHLSIDTYAAQQWDYAPERDETTEVGFLVRLFFDASVDSTRQ